MAFSHVPLVSFLQAISWSIPLLSISVLRPLLRLRVRRPYRSNWAFPGFEKDGKIDAESIVFSPNGATLYVAGGSSVYATSSDGDQEAHWSVALSDSGFCDMAISPDGLSVYISGCSSGVINHLQLDEANGVVISNATFSTDYPDAGGKDAGNAFLIEALDMAVVFCRSDSDEVGINTSAVLP